MTVKKSFMEDLVPRFTRRQLPALAAALATPSMASAQAFLSRPITIIVPFAAGGPTDTVARLLGEAMGRDLNTSVVVENVGGAGGWLHAAGAPYRDEHDPDAVSQARL